MQEQFQPLEKNKYKPEFNWDLSEWFITVQRHLRNNGLMECPNKNSATFFDAALERLPNKFT